MPDGRTSTSNDIYQNDNGQALIACCYRCLHYGVLVVPTLFVLNLDLTALRHIIGCLRSLGLQPIA